MNKQDWKMSSTALRALLGTLQCRHRENTMVLYKFGFVYDRRFDYYVLWNGLSRNIVATIRFIRGKMIIRYRPNSYYRYILSSFRLDGYETIPIPSNNLGRHRGFPRGRLQDRIERSLLVTSGSSVWLDEIASLRQEFNLVELPTVEQALNQTRPF